MQLGQSTSDQVREGARGLVSDQLGRPDAYLVTPSLINLAVDQRTIIALCEVPAQVSGPDGRLGSHHRTFFRSKCLQPVIQAGLIRMTRPSEPNDRD